MVLIFFMSKPNETAVYIISKIYLPMMVGQIGIGFLVSIAQGMQKEKDEIAAFQSKLALNIANKTLPYFGSINDNSLQKICSIIKEIHSDAVSITDKNKVLAYVGVGEETFKDPNLSLSNITKEAMKKNKILNVKVNKDEHSLSEKVNLKTALIIPLTDSYEVVGT